MKTKQIFWKLGACACAVFLTACGSSGGGSPTTTKPAPHNGANQQNPTVNQPNNNGSNSGSNQQNTTANQNTTKFGGSATKFIDKNGNFSEYGTNKPISGNNLDKIIVDGKELTLIDPGIQVGSWYTNNVKNQDYKKVHGGYSYTRFGVYESHNEDSFYLISHGQFTDANKVPTTGTATYVGHAVYASNQTDGWDTGSAKFNVNYGNKTIDGTVSIPKANSVALKGTISGNAFSGTHNGTNMQGHFFGSAAEELSGTFHKGTKNKPDFVGAFGAKKQ
ncbi:Slam-dependent surface lipoprotein [Wielerella bovis]|nr:Slam-dependent surface lipoprotein [Wielerella bovis]ULJ63515.1 transferrin-binding protein-like solute binding protein [Wielerella bovis]ULJ65680.1 transferrin-binding protein-like solute binding protein [Wielerella bovis]ULJ66277.1 transferrin-binding protein-like solute binding protein [Wielerella bovis]